MSSGMPKPEEQGPRGSGKEHEGSPSLFHFPSPGVPADERLAVHAEGRSCLLTPLTQMPNSSIQTIGASQH